MIVYLFVGPAIFVPAFVGLMAFGYSWPVALLMSWVLGSLGVVGVALRSVRSRQRDEADPAHGGDGEA